MLPVGSVYRCVKRNICCLTQSWFDKGKMQFLADFFQIKGVLFSLLSYSNSLDL